MFYIDITKLTNFSWFHVLRIQKTNYTPHFTCGGILYFLKHKHTAWCGNTVRTSANCVVPWHRINKLGTHAQHCDHSAAAAILANTTYFLDNPHTMMILSVEQQLLDRWHFYDNLQKQKCNPQGLYGCCHYTKIMLGKLMTCLDMLSALLLELHDVSVLVEGFLVPQPWSPYYPTVTAISLQEGGLVKTFCQNHYLSPPFFYWFLSESKYCWSI